MTAQELLNKINHIQSTLVQVVNATPDAPVRAYISDNDGNIFNALVSKIGLETDDGQGGISIAILSTQLGEFING